MLQLNTKSYYRIIYHQHSLGARLNLYIRSLLESSGWTWHKNLSFFDFHFACSIRHIVFFSWSLIQIADGTRYVYDVMHPIIRTRDEAKIVCQDNLIQKQKSEKPIASRYSSMANIQFLVQNSQKVSYDICKNNEHVAKLILLRGAFRLGEPVIGIIDFEESSIPCFKVRFSYILMINNRFQLF